MESPITKYKKFILDAILDGSTNISIAEDIRAMGTKTSEASVRRLIANDQDLREAAEQRNLRYTTEQYTEAPGTSVSEDEVIIVGEPTTERTNVEDLLIEDILKRRQLDPDEWEVKQILDNQWDANAGSGKKITLYQFKIWLSRKVPLKFVFPATPKIDLPLPEVKLSTDKPILIVACGDQQAPYHDKNLHELFLQWLQHNKPDVGVLLGDLPDWNSISRHRDDPAWDATMQDGIQSSFDILYDYRHASLNTKWKMIAGNHDAERIRNFILEKADRLYGVTPAQYPGDEEPEWVFSLNHLLHLERLGIEYVDSKAGYEFQQIVLSDILSARHGHYTSKDASLKTVVELGHNVILGHTHSQSIKKQTVYDSIHNTWKVLTAIEAGCMCEIVGGIGFANAGLPNWQPGFVGITLFPDGTFSADLATFDQSNVLRWRDQYFKL